MTLLDPPSQKTHEVSIRFDWTLNEIKELLEKPLIELLWQAQLIHRSVNPEYNVQLASLLSVKTGGCEEDCSYCSQSIHNASDITDQSDFDVRGVLKPVSYTHLRAHET